MFGFFIKKSFCDTWDNLLSVFITNLVFLFSGLGFVYLAIAIAKAELGWVLLAEIFFAIVFFSILALAYGEVAARIADFNGIHILDFFKAIPGCIKDGVFLGIFLSLASIISYVCLRYYFIEQKSLIGFFMGCIIFWLDVLIILSLNWFIPVRSTLHNKFFKCLKKSFILFFDNTGFSILLALYNLVVIAFSVLCIGMMPSICGLLISGCNAFRLRLYKYDYLEEHPELKTKRERSHIPWEDLIFEDREALGPRNFKSFIMPWKAEQK